MPIGGDEIFFCGQPVTPWHGDMHGARNPSHLLDACVSTNVPTWSVNYFYLMVRRRGIKCVHLSDLFLCDGGIEGRH